MLDILKIITFSKLKNRWDLPQPVISLELIIPIAVSYSYLYKFEKHWTHTLKKESKHSILR